MISVKKKENCCACGACKQICPNQCISMSADRDGFLYPEVHVERCIDCGLCEKVCPIINQADARQPIKVYAAKNDNEDIRLRSSSGGIFTFLAERILEEDGVVFGAKFDDNWNVVHDYTENKDGLEQFRGSKYVQSDIGDSYIKAERFLKDGRKVMFTGTSCQIAGLNRYLRKEYTNLLTVDVVCHGVPSPLIWATYLKEEISRQIQIDKNAVLSGVNFRDKSSGWKDFSFVLKFSCKSEAGNNHSVFSSVFSENDYMRAFLSNLSLRPSCYKCPVRAGKSGSNITIGDFWGINKFYPELDDDKGVNLVLLYAPIVLPLNGFQEVTYEQAIKGNYCVENSVDCPVASRYRFFNVFHGKRSVIKAVDTVMRRNLLYKGFRLLDKLIYRINNK